MGFMRKWLLIVLAGAPFAALLRQWWPGAATLLSGPGAATQDPLPAGEK